MPQKILVCTDLDRTLLPNGKQPESPEARVIFARLVARPEVTLAYVSGRHRELVKDAIEEYQLPPPDWVIGDVGTTIYQLQAEHWLPLSTWEQDIASDWNGLTATDLKPLFQDLPVLQLQESAKQNRHKLSYYLPLGTDIPALLETMEQRLSVQKLSASLIYSIDEAAEIGLLDVLPARATKLHAVQFLMQQQQFDYTNTIFAGDSGNDLPVITSAVKSVLVANADNTIVEQAKTGALQQDTMAAFYVAQGGFLGMNGNYSAGIIEGIAHYFPTTLSWMENTHDH